ncbi:TPM domain-containing protein [Phenylobacterium montanum]|uniref:DUF5130 family protein n=1 Tax=Phenylobacterium montanum TaxID=2823693 RepID=A0A975ITM5_9CAUL|nr:DUF5130 family protein [Caulobacter sp. S6]QUD86624.1 DUF5130 family protein [Caulobacter sp. S6]
MLSKSDHQRIADAIATAETATRGEIFCVVAHESGAYRETAFAWAAGLALAGPPVVLLAGFRPWERIATGDWSTGAMAHPHPMTILMGYATVQALLFAASLLLISLPAARRVLTPPRVKRARVHARALEQFAHRLHATEAETGVLIYASLAERRVEVIADELIHAKVGDAAWDQAVAAALARIRQGDIAGGLVAAIESCGAVLARHCPVEGDRASPPGGEAIEI